MRRVVIGNFGAIAGMGIRELVAQCACRVIAEVPDGRQMAKCVEAHQPDAVVVDADHDDGEGLAAELSQSFPSVVVVAVSSSRPQLRVYPPHGRPYGQTLDGEALARALG